MRQCFSEGDWQAYLDREMSADEMARAEAHLEQCGECAALHKDMAGRAERVALLMTDLASAAGILRQPSLRPQAWRWAVPVGSLAAALVAALFVVWLWPPQSVRPAVARTATAPRTEAPAAAEGHVEGHVDQIPRPLKRAARRRVVRPREAPDPLLAGLASFIALDDEPIETAVIVRVTLDDGLARADVMVGPDGRARGIRMVPGNSGE